MSPWQNMGLAHLTNPNRDIPVLTYHIIIGIAYSQQSCQNQQQRNTSCLAAFGAPAANTTCKRRHQDEDKYYDHFNTFENALNPGDSSSIPETGFSTSNKHIPSDPTST